ncbi:MAG: 50S ribosomal protein L21 [Chitinophagaceae bacterium]|nr:MAG: 50S ribosomal protein L21 [Chitinophagaceae bacterium]
MYAVVNIGGQQLKVSKGQKVVVNRIDANEGDKVDFSDVLFTNNDGKVSVGTPFVSNAKVSATIDKHFKGDKVIIFKKKRRKGYKVKNGHRQHLTQLTIETIS